MLFRSKLLTLRLVQSSLCFQPRNNLNGLPSLSLSLSFLLFSLLTLNICLSSIICLSFSACLYLYFSLNFFLSVSLSLYRTLHDCLSFSFSASLSVFLSHSFPVYLSLSLLSCLSFSFIPFLSILLSHSSPVCLPLSLLFCLSSSHLLSVFLLIYVCLFNSLTFFQPVYMSAYVLIISNETSSLLDNPFLYLLIPFFFFIIFYLLPSFLVPHTSLALFERFSLNFSHLFLSNYLFLIHPALPFTKFTQSF